MSFAQIDFEKKQIAIAIESKETEMTNTMKPLVTKLCSVRIINTAAKPPRLVRANSAFEKK